MDKAKEVEKMLTPELQEMAQMIGGKLPEGWGFGLVIFEYSDSPGAPLLWVSSASREMMVEAMREFVERNGG